MSLVETKDSAPTAADAFHKMGDLITHNAGQSFGGAFVIMPPEGEAITSLFLNAASGGMFWATLKTICEQQLNEIDNRERQLQSGMMRR